MNYKKIILNNHTIDIAILIDSNVLYVTLQDIRTLRKYRFDRSYVQSTSILAISRAIEVVKMKKQKKQKINTLCSKTDSLNYKSMYFPKVTNNIP